LNRAWYLQEAWPDEPGRAGEEGTAAIGLFGAGEKFLPGRPTWRCVSTLADRRSVAGSVRAGHGIAMSAHCRPDLPDLTGLHCVLKDVDGVLPLPPVLSIGVVERYPDRTLAAKHGYEISRRQELHALERPNCAAFSQGFPIAGGLSQSASQKKRRCADAAGACVPASARLGICLVFLDTIVCTISDRHPSGDSAGGTVMKD